MFCGFRHGFDCLRDGEGTLTPHSKLGEGIPFGPQRGRNPEASPLGALPSSLVLRERGKNKTEARVPAPWRRRLPLVWYWGGREGMGVFGCGVWVCILFCLLGFGSAMEGPGLGCRTSMAPTPTLVASAAVLPFPSRMPWETCRCRGRLCVGTSALRISARPLSGTAYRLD